MNKLKKIKIKILSVLKSKLNNNWIKIPVSFFTLIFVAYFFLSKYTVNHQIDFIYGDTRILLDTIYLNDNGAHVDIIIPQNNEFVSYGWGSKIFYLNVSKWEDLTFKIAFQALLTKPQSLMHVTKYKSKRDKWVSVPVTKTQLKKIKANIDDSFVKSDGKHVFASKGYHSSDMFYYAKGRYHAFYTCNSWANDLLKTSDMYACLWTVFSDDLMSLYKS